MVRTLNDIPGKLMKADKVLPHSNRGVPYLMEACFCKWAEHGIVQSMSHKARMEQCADEKLLCDTEIGVLLSGRQASDDGADADDR